MLAKNQKRVNTKKAAG